MTGSTPLPPDPLEPLADPCYDGQPGPYAFSPLRDVCGTRINPDALPWYQDRIRMISESGAISCAHPQLAAWLEQVGSFDPHARITQPPMAEWPLTPVIPRIVVWGEQLPFPIRPGSYTVDYRYLNTRKDRLPERRWVRRLKDRFEPGTDLYLSFFGDPELNFSLWTLPDFWKHPFLDQFDGIVMPDFSAYCNDPIPQSLIGERMLQIFATEGSDAGRNVIPSIAWRSEDSLRRQIDLWASLYPKVHTIQLDCDGFGVNPTMWWWRWLMAMENYCADLPHIRFLIAGRVNGWVIGELRRIFPHGNFHLIPSVSLFVSSCSSLKSKQQQGETFQRKVKRLEAFWSGEEVAEPLERPDRWPSFRDCARAV